MKLASFRQILGAFRLLRRRSIEVERPGLTIWADAGEKAARDMSAGVVKLAHADEIATLEAKREIEDCLADLRAGRPAKAVAAHLQRADRLATRGADLAHDIGEAVQP